ncbi:hypothetical protein ACOME3_006367 [Neoechinorhynchus agilis]
MSLEINSLFYTILETSTELVDAGFNFLAAVFYQLYVPNDTMDTESVKQLQMKMMIEDESEHFSGLEIDTKKPDDALVIACEVQERLSEKDRIDDCRIRFKLISSGSLRNGIGQTTECFTNKSSIIKAKLRNARATYLVKPKKEVRIDMKNKVAYYKFEDKCVQFLNTKKFSNTGIGMQTIRLVRELMKSLKITFKLFTTLRSASEFPIIFPPCENIHEILCEINKSLNFENEEFKMIIKERYGVIDNNKKAGEDTELNDEAEYKVIITTGETPMEIMGEKLIGAVFLKLYGDKTSTDFLKLNNRSNAKLLLKPNTEIKYKFVAKNLKKVDAVEIFNPGGYIKTLNIDSIDVLWFEGEREKYMRFELIETVKFDDADFLESVFILKDGQLTNKAPLQIFRTRDIFKNDKNITESTTHIVIVGKECGDISRYERFELIIFAGQRKIRKELNLLTLTDNEVDWNHVRAYYKWPSINEPIQAIRVRLTGAPKITWKCSYVTVGDVKQNQCY